MQAKSLPRLVEVAWYLPGGHENDAFKDPVTFVNIRGDALQCPAVSERMFASSSIVYIFVKDIIEDVEEFMGRMKDHIGKACPVLEKKPKLNHALKEFNLKKTKLYVTQLSLLSRTTSERLLEIS